MSGAGKAFLVIGLLLALIGIAALALSLLGLLPRDLAVIGVTPLILGVVFGGSGLYMVMRGAREERIRREGIPGLAKVIDWWIVGKSGGSLDLVETCGFELEITVGGRPPYRIKHRQLVPFRALQLISKGGVLPVNVDPRNPRRVVIMWDRDSRAGAGPASTQ